MGLRHQIEYVLVGYLPGSRTLHGTDLVTVAAVGPGTADRYPTQKHDGLGRAIAAIAGIDRDDVVVDPFCGSGALLVGATERGATVIGGDVAVRAVKLATARLRRTVTTGRRGPARGAMPPARHARPLSQRPSNRAQPPVTGRKRTRSAPSTDLVAPIGGKATGGRRRVTGSTPPATGRKRTGAAPSTDRLARTGIRR